MFSTLEKFVQILMCQYRAVLCNKSPKTRHKIWAFFPLGEMSNKKPCSSSHHLQTWQFPSRHGIWEVPIKYHMSASLGSCRSAVFWYRPLAIFLKGHKIAKYPRKSSFCFFSWQKNECNTNASRILNKRKEEKRQRVNDFLNLKTGFYFYYWNQ